jgi:two-component system cell cycle sensor histidine kinase/response regulator CckA
MNEKGTSYIVILVALCGFALFVFINDRTAAKRAAANLDSHAAILSEALWNFDDTFAHEYLQLACRTENYDHVVILDTGGIPFVSVDGVKLHGIDSLLTAAGLIQALPFSSRIIRDGLVIGTIEATWYRKTIYLYSYSFFALLLALAVFHMYLRIKQANQMLERRVKIRTSELEASNISLQQEVMERLNAEKALKQSHETFKTVMDSLDATIYVADMETYEVLFMNRHLRETLEEQVANKLCWQILGHHKEQGPCPHCTNERLIDAEGNPKGTLIWEGQNPKTGNWYMNYDRAIRWIDGRLVHLQIAIDISRFKELEKQRLEAEAKFQQAQKLEALGTLAGGIAHDFNNLLMGMLGNISLLMLELPSDADDYQKLARIEKQILSGSNLTNQLLGYARKGKYEIRPLDINRVVCESVATFARTRKEIHVHQRLSEKPVYVEADSGQMEQVLLNILINAADAMPEGGDLTVHTRSVPYTFLEGKPFAPKAGEYALLQIIDTGTGMNAEVQERIFEPFFTTKDMGRGTGLGLASAYGIVKSHNGFIDVESVKGKGSTFSILLPRIDRNAPAGIKPDVSVKKAPRSDENSGTILLVDDEPMIMEVCTSLLKRLGYQVIEAVSGEQAVELFRERHAEIDLVLLDMVMPDMSGSDVFDQLIRIDPAVRILLSSGYSLDGKAREILDRGCRGFIQKPYTYSALSEKVRSILSRDETQAEESL